MPNKTTCHIRLSLSAPALPGHKLSDIENFHFFSKKIFRLQFLQSKETSTQLGLQVDACGKPYN